MKQTQTSLFDVYVLSLQLWVILAYFSPGRNGSNKSNTYCCDSFMLMWKTEIVIHFSPSQLTDMFINIERMPYILLL